jgi:hypothetical protein
MQRRSVLAIPSAALAFAGLSLAASSASAQQPAPAPGTYAPPPNYNAPPSYAPPPNYNPPSGAAQPPTYAPPPTYAQPQPNGAQPYGQQPYGAQPYGSPGYAPGQPYGRAAAADAGRPGWSAAGIVGFGTASIYGFGLGARGGYTFPQHVYVGGEFSYFFGSSIGSYSYANYQLGPEVGYEFTVPSAPVLIRPYVGLGLEGVTAGTYCVSGSCLSPGGTTGLALWGGAVATYNFGRNWFVGGDVRLIIPTFGSGATAGYPSPTYVGLAIAATGGFKF